MTTCALTRMVFGVEAMSGRRWRALAREVIVASCPRCRVPVTCSELARNHGVCVTCCIEAETDTFVFDPEPPTH